MSKRRWTYLAQVVGVLLATIGLYKAFGQPSVFWPSAIGVGLFFGASRFRQYLDDQGPGPVIRQV
jgi:hypothetical protein